MTVYLCVGPRRFELGSADFVHAFFSTVSHHLEPTGWGTMFPQLLGTLYSEVLTSENVHLAKKELESVKKGLAKLEPAKVVWDIEDATRRPPWGANISKDITSLANYFVTSDGKDLLQVLAGALEFASQHDATLSLAQL